MTYTQLKTQATKLLSANPDVENPDFEVTTIICHFAGIGKAKLLSVRAEEIEPDTLLKMQNAVRRRADGEPLQYVIGEWEFFGLRMFCGEGCLIPRPETELLVEKAIELLPEGTHFLDLCSGSGCISVAILNNRKDVTGTAVDISSAALKYAEKNGLKIVNVIE